MSPTEVSGIPEHRVHEEVRRLIASGAKDIHCTRQDDGTWTIRVA